MRACVRAGRAAPFSRLSTRGDRGASNLLAKTAPDSKALFVGGTVALALREQMVQADEEIPTNEWDRLPDSLITPDGIYE